MLNSLPLVVLGTTSQEELVITAEPIEDVFVSIPGTFKERVFSVAVSHLQTLVLVLLEDFKHLEVLHSCSK